MGGFLITKRTPANEVRTDVRLLYPGLLILPAVWRAYLIILYIDLESGNTVKYFLFYIFRYFPALPVSVISRK